MIENDFVIFLAIRTYCNILEMKTIKLGAR